MPAAWVLDEMQHMDPQDRRLDARLREVLDQLAARPTASIPAACGGRAEMEAAYRLFDNDRVTFDNILQAHQAATRQRAVAWTRDDAPPRRQTLTPAERLATPLEEKGSYRWVVALRQAREAAAQQAATQMVCVADSEADSYELLVEGMREPRSVEWMVRACQNRALQAAEAEEAPAAPYLREQVLAQPVLFTQTLSIRGRETKVGCSTRGRDQPRQARQAEVEVRATRVTLRPPRRPGQTLPAVSVNVVLVREPNPPAGDVPVEWLLLTSLPIDQLEQVRRVIASYCVRWMVEVFLRTLKSGCRAEERRFEQIDRQLRCLAVSLIVAWRTLYVCRLGRACPELSCKAIFEPAEWKSVYRVVMNQPPPDDPPSLGDLVRMIARLGGYVDRPRHDPPGPQTVWLGLQRMHDFARCWELFGPETRAE